jgi:cytohesin
MRYENCLTGIMVLLPRQNVFVEILSCCEGKNRNERKRVYEMKRETITSNQVLFGKKHITATGLLPLALIAVVIGTVAPPALADGGFVSALIRDVTAPEQKVAISWNGEIETMILATKVRSTEIGNLGWIIPIKAIEKPEVELGDIKIFYDLSEYFGNKELDWAKKKGASGGGSLGFESIQILEEKELDIYDITVLKATDADQFQKWLKANGFRTNQASKKVLRSYTHEDFFLITVKIDLSNNYKGDVKQLQLGLYTPLKISFKANEAFFPLKISSINPGRVNIVAYVFAENPQKDKGGLLEVFKWQPLTRGFRLRTSSYLPVSGLRTVTKLTFQGPSSEFTEDVFFTDMTIWGKVWCLSKHYKQVDFSLERLLFDAARNGDIEALRIAVANGVDVNKKAGRSGHTPLYVAANGGHIKAVEFLIEKGAGIDPKGYENKTPLHVAAYEGNREMTECLIDYGADVNARNKNGRTPLHRASENTIELLVSSGADINAGDNRGKTPLHWTARLGYKAKTKLLIALGADINAPDKIGNTPLHEVGVHGHTNIVGVLIAGGADLNAKNKAGGLTPSAYAIRGSCRKVGELIKQVEGAKSVASLHGACLRGNFEEASVYISEGSDVNAKYKFGRASLHIAAALGYEEIVELLIAKGADIDAQDERGWTALHEAAKFGHENIARLLLKSGADARIQNKIGRTPLEITRWNNLTSWRVAKLLREHLEKGR